MIPTRLIRDVFGNDDVRRLLLLIAKARGGNGVGYAEARRELEIHPQAFQRAVDRLESWGLLGLEAPLISTEDDPTPRNHVRLTVTALGHFTVEVWERWVGSYEAAARDDPPAAKSLARRADG